MDIKNGIIIPIRAGRGTLWVLLALAAFAWFSIQFDPTYLEADEAEREFIFKVRKSRVPRTEANPHHEHPAHGTPHNRSEGGLPIVPMGYIVVPGYTLPPPPVLESRPYNGETTGTGEG